MRLSTIWLHSNKQATCQWKPDTYTLTGGHKTGSPIMQCLIATKNKLLDMDDLPDVTKLTNNHQEEAFELDMATLFLQNADKH
jgi:hypothetical protein